MSYTINTFGGKVKVCESIFKFQFNYLKKNYDIQATESRICDGKWPRKHFVNYVNVFISPNSSRFIGTLWLGGVTKITATEAILLFR